MFLGIGRDLILLIVQFSDGWLELSFLLLGLLSFAVSFTFVHIISPTQQDYTPSKLLFLTL